MAWPILTLWSGCSDLLALTSGMASPGLQPQILAWLSGLKCHGLAWPMAWILELAWSSLAWLGLLPWTSGLEYWPAYWPGLLSWLVLAFCPGLAWPFGLAF